MRLFRKFRALLRNREVDTDMAEEMQHHLDTQMRLNLAAGMSPEDARDAARRSFGGVEQIKERAREQRGFRWLNDFGRDFRFALRALHKNPAFTAVAVLSLALGVGANTAIFSVVNAVLLKSLPVSDPQSLVLFSHQGKNGPPEHSAENTNFPLYEFLRDSNQSFSGLFAFSPTHLRVRRDAKVEGVSAQWVTPNYFSVLGLNPILGRAWTAEDEAGPAVVMISHRFWRRYFAGDPEVVGKLLFVSGKPATVIGVAPPEFLGLTPGTPVDLTLLLTAQPAFQPERGDLPALGRGIGGEPAPTWDLFIMGRLKAGVSSVQAEAETTLVLRQWAANHRLSDTLIESSFYRAELAPGGKGLDALRRRFSAPLWVLMGIVGFVLLIACANIANLLLARAAARRHEIAVRAAIGASRGRLVRQLLTESLTLTALGGAAGGILGWWGSSLLVTLIATGRTPVELDAQPDGRVLLFTLVVAALAGLGVGLVPALRGSMASSAPALREAGLRGNRRKGSWSLGQTLVSAQLGLSLCLLVGTGLFARNLRQIAAIDPGFKTENLLSVAFDWSGAGFNRGQIMSFAQSAVGRAETLPGVQSASTTFIEPLGEQQSQRWLSVLPTTPGSASPSVVDYNVVSTGYFKTMNLPLAHGRDFDTRDSANAPKVAIISQALARYCFGSADPVGQPIWISREPTGTPIIIVGVAQDAKQRDLRDAPLRLLYQPSTQSTAREMTLLVRSEGAPMALAAELQRALADLSPDISVREITTAQLQMERSLLQERLLATLSGFFGPLALLLAAIGLYGLLAYDVTQRTREIGVRVALGARSSDVLGLVLKRGMLLVAVGTVAGLVAASALARLMQRFLFSISSSDPTTLLSAVIVLALAALFACWLPARRATKVDPMVALRCE